jgi:hypothetical protein
LPGDLGQTLALMLSVSRPIHSLLILACRASAVISQEAYTQNSVCRKNNCKNPIFPGLNDLPALEQITWQCDPTRGTVRKYLNFCEKAILYDPALPSPNATSVELSKLVQAQDQAASTMYFFHLSALGYESWDYTKPENSPDGCVRSIWRLVCNTYFPKAPAGCQPQSAVQYLRPSQTACTNYLQACQVECCDESPQCVFTHQIEAGQNTFLQQSGYVDADAPSALCTGMGISSGRRAAAPLLALLLGVAGLQLATLGGGAVRPNRVGPVRPVRVWKWGLACGLAVVPSARGYDLLPQHSVGNWRQEPDYLHSYSMATSTSSNQAALNSCGQAATSVTQQCSGRGYCKAFNPAPGSSSFCYCDSEYADPECRTTRKSQFIAFFLSLFGGFLGLDYVYLGLPLVAVAKVCTLGGLGMWWLVDIIRIGTGPVYAHDFRVAPDLPKFVFLLSTVSVFMVGSFILSMLSYLRYRAKKRGDVQMLMQSEEEHVLRDRDVARLGPQFGTGGPDFKGPRGFSGYGATLPTSLPNAGTPYAQLPGPGMEPGPFAGPYG